tara:strand:- start:30061 stop:30456 length:396 start_codon:yes stop_codon:yes gene_type:complete
MIKNWKKEVSRDLMALGSFPFLILVIVRVSLVGNFKIIFNIFAALILAVLISSTIKKLNYHSVNLTILIIFTSIFYASYTYAIFATITYFTAIYGINKYLKKKNVYLSVLAAILCSIISYLIELPLQIPNL